MKITLNKETTKLTLSIEGSIDTVTAPELEKTLLENWDGFSELILDFATVDYISSAGLRVVMLAGQRFEEIDGSMTILNTNDDVKEVFEMTGFDSLFNIE